MLRDCLRKFLRACRKAIVFNEQLAKDDQREFHTELHNGYRKLKKYTETLLDDDI